MSRKKRPAEPMPAAAAPTSAAASRAPRMRRSAPADAVPRLAWPVALGVLALLAAVTVLAYRAAFHTPFIFDDRLQILLTPALQPGLSGAEIWSLLWQNSRPVVLATLLLNHHWGGFDTYGYHVLNVLIHLCAGVVLFLLVRRTLHSPRCQARYGAQATALALAVALLWLVHPLQTQAVTYVIQRAEALVSLCLLVALYATARAASSPRAWAWHALVGVVLVAGFLSKPVMVVAPVLLALYEGVFSPAGWRAVWPQGRLRYALLFAATMMLSLYTLRHGTSEGNAATATSLQYLLSQGGVLTHYLSLTFWPAALCLDYYWPIAKTAGQILPYGALILALLAASTVALWRAPGLGFVGLAFFVVLSVTSSILPIADLAFEHRMYLALAAPVILVVLAVEALGRRLPAVTRRALGWSLLAVAVLALGWRTDRRNHDYASELSIWEAALKVRPDNPRAYSGRGYALVDLKRYPEAEKDFRICLAKCPEDFTAHNELGIALHRQHRYAEAAVEFELAIKYSPNFPEAHYSLGCTYDRRSQTATNPVERQQLIAQAVAEYERALAIKPRYPDALNDLASQMLLAKQWDRAEDLVRRCLACDPTHANAKANLASIQLARVHLARGEDITVSPAPPSPD